MMMTTTTLRRLNKRKRFDYFFVIAIVSGLIVIFNVCLVQSFFSQSKETSISFLTSPQVYDDSSHDDPAAAAATLSYGVELSYILPMKALHEATAGNDNTNRIAKRFKELQKRSAKIVIMSLQEYSIQASISDFDQPDLVVPPNSWVINLENRGGLEIASYINPPRNKIHRLMKVFNDTNFQIDSDTNAIHINVDARNRTKDEIRDVYKNYLSVEDAIDKIRTSTMITVSGVAKPMGKKFRSTEEAYQAMNDPIHFPYPAYNHRTLPDGSIIQDPDIKMPALCLRSSPSRNSTRRIEFRGIQSSLDSNVVWSWIQFARKFVEVSYSGVVLEPKERTPDEQWEALFGEIIQDQKIESSLKAWERDMYIANPNREAIIEAICPIISKRFAIQQLEVLLRGNERRKKEKSGRRLEYYVRWKTRSVQTIIDVRSVRKNENDEKRKLCHKEVNQLLTMNNHPVTHRIILSLSCSVQHSLHNVSWT